MPWAVVDLRWILDVGASPLGSNYFIFMQFLAAFLPKINEHAPFEVCTQLEICFLMLYYVVGLEFK